MIAKRVNRVKGTSDFGRLVNYLLDTQENPEILYQTPEMYGQEAADDRKVAWFDLKHCDSDTPAFLIAEIEATQAQNTRSRNDKTYHLVVSFPVGERPSQAVIRDIEQTLCEGVGLSDHQRLLVVHQDTEHFHLHIAINKVHPETLRCIEPYYDHYKLNDLCRALEEKHQLRKDNRIEPDKSRNQAQDMEAHSGEQSLLSWLKVHVKDELLACLKTATNWQTIHDTLASYGLTIKPRGAGLVIGDPEKDVYVKASSLSRKLSFKPLTEQLGPFVVSSKGIAQDPEKPVYEPAPKQAHPEAKDLYAQYQAQQEETRQKRWNALSELKSEHRQYVKYLKGWYNRQYKNLRYSLFLTPADKRARYKYLSTQRHKDMMEQREKYANSKRTIMEQTRCQTWTVFLKEQVQAGNTKALGILRSQEREQAKAAEQLIKAESLAKARDIIYQGLKPKILKNGTAIYRLKDGGQIRDEKGCIQVPKVTEGSVLLALMMAKERFSGQSLVIDGSYQFKEHLMAVATKHGLKLDFACPEHRLVLPRQGNLTDKNEQTKER